MIDRERGPERGVKASPGDSMQRKIARSSGSKRRSKPLGDCSKHDAIARAGGFRISDGFISPLDLIAIGMMTAAEAQELAQIEAG